MAVHRGRMKIYASGKHLTVTLFVIVMPFLFLFFFSRLANLTGAHLFYSIFISSLRLLVAYLIATVIAWLWAVGFYRGKRAAIALPIFDVLQSFPTFAALPLATLFWGPSNFTVIFFLVITVIWPIFFSIVSSLKLIKHDWEEAAEIAGIKGLDYVKNFLWPASIPGLITGSIIGLGEGWEALVATEIIVKVPDGLGKFFQYFSGNPTVTIFGVLGLLILIFSVNKLIWLPLLERGYRETEE